MKSFIKNKWKNEYSLVIISTLFCGLLVHIYKFTNNLPNSDSMFNFFNHQGSFSNGRWFLSFACSLSSFYDLPWINGLFSLIYISITALIIIKLFQVKKPVLIFVISLLMVTFPSVTEILCYEFTADGFILAMLLSSLATYIIILGNLKDKRILASLLSSVLICLSCGIYQAYVSFSIVLFIIYFVWILFTENYSNKKYLKYCLSFIIPLIAGLLLYYIVWKVGMLIFGIAPIDYQGINKIGVLSPSEFLNALKSVAYTFVSFVLEKNVLKHGISLYAVLNLIYIVFSAFIWAVSIKKSQLYKNKFKLVCLIVCVLSMPFAICMWQFASPDVSYALRMLHSIVIIYIFSAILCDKYMNNNLFKSFVVTCFVIVINLSIQANIAYYYLNFEYENTYYEAVELKYSLNRALEQYGEDHKIAIIGHREKEVALDFTTEANGTYMFTKQIEKSFLFETIHTQEFLKNVLYFDGEFANSETRERIEKTIEYSEMKPFFKRGSIKLINDVITVKLGEE